MVLEYCAKGSLFTVLSDLSLTFDWSLFLKVALDTIKGILALHSWKPPIVHRDMKSLNLLVDENWGVKVSDFGLSRFTGQTQNQSTLSKLRGTYAYTAPEIYFGKHYTAKSDIFAYGIILWEMAKRTISGYYEQPYSEYPHLVYDFQIIIQVAKSELRPTIPENCPPHLVAVIKGCWNADPEKRPDAGQLLKAVSALDIEYNRDPKEWDSVINTQTTPGPNDDDSNINRSNNNDEKALNSSNLDDGLEGGSEEFDQSLD